MQNRATLLIYDLIGIAAICALAALGAWSAGWRLPAATSRVAQARAQLDGTREKLAQTELALRKWRSEREQLERDIAERGALPQHSPVEADLREISRIARDHGVETIQVTPVAGERYPGLIELRYALEARSDFAALVAFLESFEESHLWADLFGLEIRSPAGGTDDAEGKRTASLVVSLYASKEAAVPGSPQ